MSCLPNLQGPSGRFGQAYVSIMVINGSELMALARAAAGQVQLGDDDDREARRAAVIAEMDARTDPTADQSAAPPWVEGSYYLNILYYEVNTAGTFPYYVLYVLKLVHTHGKPTLPLGYPTWGPPSSILSISTYLLLTIYIILLVVLAVR